MSKYTFSSEKNLKLVEERNISFEEIIAAIADNQILDILEHPDKKKYGNQQIYVIAIRDYVFLAPFVTDSQGDIFLKTIIPSRKAKRKYIAEEGNEKK